MTLVEFAFCRLVRGDLCYANAFICKLYVKALITTKVTDEARIDLNLTKRMELIDSFMKIDSFVNKIMATSEAAELSHTLQLGKITNIYDMCGI